MYNFGKFGKAQIDKANDPAPKSERLDPRLKLLEMIGTMPVYLVDGEMVRGKLVGSRFCRWYLDFTEGSNPAEAPEWMPDEIWIDNANLDAFKFILLHELHEYNVMLDEKLEYDPAHDRANVVEGYARLHPDELSDLLDRERNRVIERQQSKQAQDAAKDKFYIHHFPVIGGEQVVEDAAFKESDHPRGQPGNAGQFGSGGGGGKKTKQKSATPKAEGVSSRLEVQAYEALKAKNLSVGSWNSMHPKVAKMIHSKPPVMTPQFSLAAKAMASAVDSLPNKLSKHLREHLEIVFAAYQPEEASMSVVHDPKGSLPKDYMLINTNADPSQLYTSPETAISFASRHAYGVYEETSDKDKAIEYEYKLSFYHELGHMLDNMMEGGLSSLLVDDLKSEISDDDYEVQQWLSDNVSPYASTSLHDATAEVFSMIMSDAKLPKELKPFAKVICRELTGKVVQDQQDVNAAGVILRAPNGSMLFLRRSDKGDHAGEWCFPGGGIEDDENPEDAAKRELIEETRIRPPESIDHVHKGSNGFHTFGADVPAAYTPQLNDEHDRFTWSDIDHLPQPLHPGVQEMFELAKPKETGKDMAGKDWRGLIKGMLKFFMEEAEEPEHQGQDAKKAVYGIKEVTGSPHSQRQIWKVTVDGRILGDSRGYDREGAIKDAHKSVSLDPDNRELAPEIAGDAAAEDKIQGRTRVTAENGNEKKIFVLDIPVGSSRQKIIEYFTEQNPDWKIVGSDEGASDSIAMDRATQRTVDADGHLHVATTPISKANVCEYSGHEIPDADKLGLQADKKYRLYRDPKELEKGAKTFNNKPLLSEHVPVSSEDPKHELVIGSTGTDAEFKAPYLMNSLVVWDQKAIDAIQSGDTKELSCAYRYSCEMTPGKTPDGEEYDGIMRDIIGNHVALVEKGRAGSDVMVQDAMPKEKPVFNWGFDRFTPERKPKAYDFSRFAKDEHDPKLDAGQNGVKAAKEGGSNPYPAGTKAYEQWNNGHRAAGGKGSKDEANVTSEGEIKGIQASGRKERSKPGVHVSFTPAADAGVTFADLKVGQSFDWVGPDSMMNSFYDECVKTGPRTYKSKKTGTDYRVGSVSAKVYHVS